MHIVMAASECAPWAATGGLAQVVQSLSRELARMGHQVTVYLPYYRQVSKLLPQLPVALASVTVPFSAYNRFARILDGGVIEGVRHLFVDCPEFFDREQIYATAAGNYPDNAERFGLFCRAVLEAAKILGVPDLFHVHDWPTAILPVMLRTLYYFDPLLRNVATVLTIHNAGYQGWFPSSTVQALLLPAEVYTPERMEQRGQVDFLKGGIVYADALTTVSPTYAREIQTPEFGNGLEETLRWRSPELTGILNGVEYADWNPETDPNIAAHYSESDLKGKRECRRDLLHAFDLRTLPEGTAVLGMVTRFTTQKGLDLLAAIADELMQREVALVILGDGEEYYERLLTGFAERYPGKMRVQTRYDPVMAHKVEAGADLYLMPSRYEPCGLSQIHALRYGTIPVVRATGGLEDTVDEKPEGGGDGFKFQGYEPAELLKAIDRGLAVFAQPELWQATMRRAMRKRFTWERPAAEYEAVFERAIQNRS